MKGTVTKLYDIDSIEIPEEMLDIHVEDAAIENKVQLLSLRYAKESEEKTAVKGDIVYCKADADSYPDGRTVILFTDTEMPGAEQASQEAIGKSVKDSFSAVLFDKTAVLTVQKVIRRSLAEVNDDLVCSVGIEGVKTLDEYRAYLKTQALENMRTEKEKEIAQYFLSELENSSEYAYDEKEMEALIQTSVEQYAAESAEFGEEIDPDEVKAFVISQAKQGWIAEAFCKSRDIQIDMEEIKANAEQMLEMEALAGGEVPDKTEYIEMLVQNAQFDALFGYIHKIANGKFGG